ncbi:MAG TPA: oligogalacturonate lyase family protein [Lacunisphaera sp.]|nr:oligogalacturonate lyase family protein [Lacunisphaera sp.]
MKYALARLYPCLIAALTLVGPGLRAAEAKPAAPAEPPKSWIDPDTGHRVIRLTNEPGSDSFYFNVNAYTPDGKRMVYTTPEGISLLDLTTHEVRQVVAKPARAIVVATHTATLYYSKPGEKPQVSSLWRVNLDTGESSHVADLPPRASVVTINADETLGAGTFVEGDAHAGGAYDGTPRQAPGRMSPTNLGEPVNKGEMMTRRLAAKLPMTLFTLDLKSGKINPLLEHDTNWLNHLQFSPMDPTLLLYCHEGHWWLVDRIWTIRTDGSHNQLMHQRHMKMEIAGHEWWGADGQTVFYQLHYPYHGRVSFIASVNVATGAREWLSYAPDESSIHDNSSPDGKLFCGDGDNHSPWIFLFRPHRVPGDDTLGTNLIQGGYLESEKLVNMSKHNYRLEPNPTFTPDMKYVVFRSNMFGPDYAFAVEVAKAK